VVRRGGPFGGGLGWWLGVEAAASNLHAAMLLWGLVMEPHRFGWRLRDLGGQQVREHGWFVFGQCKV
jgi:hypothetical protein